MDKNDIFTEESTPFVPEKGIGEVLFDKMKQYSDRIMQVDPETGIEETYATVLSKSIRVSQNLRKKGVKPGDVISMLSYNNMEYTSTVLASFFTGAINAPIDPTAPLLDITHCLKITSPKIIFCEKEFEELTETAIKDSGCTIEIVVFEGTENNVPYTDYLVSDPDETEEEFQLYKVKDFKSTACMHFSSGTTGLPKGVCVTHYSLLHISANFALSFSTQMTMLIVTSPFWISNLNTLTIYIVTGDRRIVVKKFDEKTIMKTIQDYKVNLTMITPINGAVLLEHPEYYSGYDVSSLKILVTGGSPTNPKQFLKYTKLFPDAVLLSGYGMTEIGGVLLQAAPQKAEELSKQEQVIVGRPISGFHYRIVDPETEEVLGPNQKGELRVKCNSLFNNYYNNRKAYEESFDSNGFFRTGDMLYYDEQHNFYYVSRIKDIFKYKGWHIPPVIIENELIKHPNVKRAVVFGVPHKLDGEHATAVVILNNKNQYNEQELLDFVKERLPERYHIHGGIYSVENIPATSTGKIQRKKLTDMFLNKKHNQ